MCCKIDLA